MRRPNPRRYPVGSDERRMAEILLRLHEMHKEEANLSNELFTLYQRIKQNEKTA